MKKIKFINLLMSMALAISFTGCSDDDPDPTPDPTESLPFIFNTNEIGNGQQDYEIPKDKAEYTLPQGTYVLKGWVYIPDGVTLTIEPGTVIKGDKATKAALIAERGGKLIAKGTKEAPIVFTSAQTKGSRRPGDWGGIILCGKARVNAADGQKIIEGGPRSYYGGTDDADNSGTISYVRIEFAGSVFDTDKEINGLTFGGVGSGTQIDHVQVSYSNDDSFEWFGGTVNAKYLIAYHGWDDEFDTDNGFSGKLQFLLSVKYPKIADTSMSNGFESDNDAEGSTLTPFTTATFSNVTFVGPIGQADDFQNTTSYITGGDLYPNNGSKLGQFQASMHIRRNSKISVFNSVAIGYPVGLILDNKLGTTQTWATNGDLKLKNLYFAGMGIVGSDVDKSFKDQMSTKGGGTVDATQQSFSHTFFTAQGNIAYDNIADLKLSQPNSLKSNPNYGPVSGSPLLNGANFDDTKLSTGFDKVTYAGAFSGADDSWATDWTNFDPQNTEY